MYFPECLVFQLQTRFQLPVELIRFPHSHTYTYTEVNVVREVVIDQLLSLQR